MLALPFAQLAHGLPEFLNLSTQGLDVIVGTGSLAARLFAFGFLATGLAFTAQGGAEAVGNLIDLLGRLGQACFTQMGDGLLHMLELSFDLSAGRAFAAVLLRAALVCSHRGARPFFGLTAQILSGIFLAGLVEIRCFLHGCLQVLFNFGARFCVGCLSPLAFVRFLFLLTGSIRLSLLARGIGFPVLSD